MKSSLLIAIMAATAARCHGGIFNYTIDGVDYAGHFPWLPEGPQLASTIQRRWWGDPIRSPNHPFLSCNRGIPLSAANPSLHAPVRAGGTITARFRHPECPPDLEYPTKPSVPGDDDPPVPLCMGPLEGFWFHTHGPLLVYMADCKGPCDQFNPAGEKVWFKIGETGLLPGRRVNDVDGWNQFHYTWDGWNVTIPRNLKPGNYLVRHEIIYIENVPAQFYPYCAQVTVTGEGGMLPKEESLVAFPGAYEATDPGIAISGFYTPEAQARDSWPTNYTIPGPEVWTGEA
ncbi:glycoside hydrolase [Cladorrhinum samala]|uniref:lytic cellulose monooxygenase (C4-dehydrogenating) n=1 Tax=Cladorrhinum samala TaxID=585594 RepID=A0AAV9HJL5_9PEZI|nr:glycoside hydrolase [Cladorrhinum samala]